MIFLNSWKMEALLLAVTALFLYYIYYRSVIATYWSKRNILHIPPNFLIGNLYKMGISIPMAEFFTEIYKTHKEKRILGMWALHKPFVVIMDRELIKHVLTRDFSNFHDRLNMEIGDHDPLASGKPG